MDVWLNYYKFQFRFISPTGAQYKMVTVVGKEIRNLNFARKLLFFLMEHFV